MLKHTTLAIENNNIAFRMFFSLTSLGEAGENLGDFALLRDTGLHDISALSTISG